MPANSLPRRIVKRLLTPVVDTGVYRAFEALIKARDIRNRTSWESEIELIAPATRPGETAIDIGANSGLYTYHLSRALGPRGKVIAFEPIPHTFKTLQWVMRILRVHNAMLIPKGCDEISGTRSFTLPLQENGAFLGGLAHLHGKSDDRPGKESFVHWTATATLQSEMTTVDEQVSPTADVSFLKCDVEGADLLALRGARDVLAKHRPLVVCEINPWYLERFDLVVGDIVGFLQALGYELFRYRDGELCACDVTAVENGNWVFVHPSRRARVASLISTD